jgi:nicotinamidase/pyrazinamidase
MKGVFFLDVDTQRDFMLPTGALYVPGAERLVPKLRRIFDFARKNDILILSTADAHTPDDPEFKQFPPHCVLGTEGQKKIDDTLLPRPLILEYGPVNRNLVEAVRKHTQIIVHKRELDPLATPVVERLARALPGRAIVFGVATEYCVKLGALGLRGLGLKVAVVTDAIRAIDEKDGKAALDEMRKAEVEPITLDSLLGIHDI